MTCKQKFWLEDLSALFSSIQVVPLSTMSLGSQINALTRLLILIFLVMMLLGFKYGIHFFLLSLAFIIIVYYIQRRTMQTCSENYVNFSSNKYASSAKLGKPYDTRSLALSRDLNLNSQKIARSDIAQPQRLFFCNDAVSLDPLDPIAVDANQNLAGLPNPKTEIAPVVIPPSHDLEYWRDNDLIVHSHINDETQQDVYLSGYAVSTCCGTTQGKKLVPDPNPEIPAIVAGGYPPYQEDFTMPSCRTNIDKESRRLNPYEQINSPQPASSIPSIPSLNLRPGSQPYRNTTERFYSSTELNDNQVIDSPRPADSIPMIPSLKRGRIQENYTPDQAIPPPNTILETVPNSHWLAIQPNQPGWVNTACGYNPDQVYNGLPSNLPVGNCVQSPVMKRYNENLFTQTVTPGVYSRNQVNEPINSNIGISFQQQFEPTTCRRDDRGVHYLEHDPRIIEPAIYEPAKDFIAPTANYDNVYDPRFYGYGTSYRSYIDNVTGQPRFMYDDVNAIRMPNYITRNKIDFLPYADSYGPIPKGNEEGNRFTPDIRLLAQDSWMRDSLQFRTEMMERLMRKRNSEMWQERVAPKGPMQYMAGQRRI